MRRVAQLIASIAAVAVPSVAAAQAPGATAYQQQPPPPARPHQPAEPHTARAGFAFGVSLGPGSIGVTDSSGDVVESYDGLAVSVSFGGMLAERVALVGDLWSVLHIDEPDDRRLVHTLVTVALQYWLTQRFYAKGGVGRSTYAVGTIDGDDDASGEARAVMGAIGYELSRGRTFAVDAQLRLGVGLYDDGDLHSGALVLGLNWY